jgi:hypothetical protein
MVDAEFGRGVARRRRVCRALVAIVTLAAGLGSAISDPASAGAAPVSVTQNASSAAIRSGCRPLLSATFLQPSYTVFPWTAQRYDSELSSMTAVGISTVILQWSVDMDADQAYYPTIAGGYPLTTDMVTPLLASASTHGANVWLGLGNVYDWQSHATDRSWLAAQMATDEHIADELWTLYRNRFSGWYISNEVDDSLLSNPVAAANIRWFFQTLTSYLHAKDGRLKVMTSPTYSGLHESTTQFAASTKQALAAVDILNVQDGGGSGYIAAADINRWFTALHSVFSSTHTALWQDADMYAVGGPMAPTQLQGDLAATCGLVAARSGFSFTTQMGPLDLGTSAYYNAYASFRSTVLGR